MDPRFKFVRGASFQGLSDYLESTPLRVKKQKNIYPIKELSQQINLFAGKVSNYLEYGVRVRSSRFYEILSQGIFGGKIKALFQVDCNGNKNLMGIEPDVSNLKKYSLREVKSIDCIGLLELNDSQIFKYYFLQTGNFLKKPPAIFFDIYRYGFTGIQSKYSIKKLNELVRDLSAKTKFMISLPFSLIFQIYENKKTDYKFTSRYEGEAAPTHTRFLSRGINELLAYPEHTLEKLEINPSNYIFEKRRSSSEIYMNEFKINQFPILLIRDKLTPEQVKEDLECRVKSSEVLSERFKLLEIECSSKENLKEQENFEEPNLFVPAKIEEAPF